ncbi:hypothetical protein [Flavobacterium sp. GCM10027622]|uniref:hypothetical protein n=1 Tax=unclassified Flavobacterium TaxID=196869 RepID=UPI00361ECA24
MTEILNFLNEYKNELTQWLEKPTVSAPPEVMEKIISTIELSLQLINTNRKVSAEEKQMIEGSSYLARYFDGWGQDYFDKYLEMVHYIKRYHY